MLRPPPFDERRPDLVAPVRIDRRGRRGPTRSQARSARWRRTGHGFYVPAAASAELVEQRIVEAAAVLPTGGAVTGWAALRWLGARWSDGTTAGGRRHRDVCLVARSHLIEQPGFAVSQEYLRPADRIVVDGLSVTTPVRSVCFEMRYAVSERQAVVAMDMAAYSDLASISEVAAYAGGLGPWTGIQRCRNALALADENAWSPREVLMRLVWQLDAERPRPLCNVPVFHRDGRHLGTPDLLDPVAGIVGEYDGSLHLVGTQRARDLNRESAFRSVGLEYVTMLASDGPDSHAFLDRLDATYRRARFEAESTRAWTIARPPWWIETGSVDARRCLDEPTRARLLRYRLTA